MKVDSRLRGNDKGGESRFGVDTGKLVIIK
jgi:hypothetical protein